MVEQYLFFSSTFADRRKYSAADIAKYWRSFIKSGVIHKNGEPSLRVKANGEGMTVALDDGKAIVFGHLYTKYGDLPFTLSPSSPSADRFDRIVLRLDNRRGEDDSRFIKAFLKKGTAEGPPELERTFVEDTPIIYELSLAQIHVKAGKSFLEQSDIIDERLDEELCGLASSLVSVPTDQFIREWNEWFQTVKDKTYITRKEFVVEQGEVKREVANLNLRLEASERVKNGVTYGTDFDTSFNMKLDDTKTYALEPVRQGDTFIKVDNADGFKIGWEISVYNGLKYEEHVIENIDKTLHIITLATPVEANFTGNPSLARSMGVLRANSLALGGYGNYTKVKAEGELMGSATASNMNPRSNSTWIVSCGGKLYARISTRGFVRDADVGVWSESTDPFRSLLAPVTNGDRYIVGFGVEGSSIKRVKYYFYDTETNTMTERLLDSPTLSTYSELSDDRRSVQMFGDQIVLLLNNVAFLFEVDYESLELRVVKHTSIPNSFKSGNYSGFTFPSIEAIKYRDGWALTLFSSRDGSTTNYRETSVHFLDGNFDFVKQDINIYRLNNANGTTNLFVENNDLHMYIVDSDTTKKLKFIHLKYNTDSSKWETLNTTVYDNIVADSEGRFDTHIIRDKNNKFYLIHTTGIDAMLYQVPIRNHQLVTEETLVLTTDARYPGQTGTSTPASFAFMDARQLIINDDMPILAYPSNARKDLVMRGSFFSGTGVPLDYNVNRYTIDRENVQEIVGWITHGNGLKVSDVKFNGEATYNHTTVNNTSQFAGIKFNNDQAEVKFTVDVLDLDADTNIKKIIGGVD